ncbi:MAG: DUF2339 domain-containing protein [Actinomycetota bacterium]|nr:DUF2339 domain-containing protein [Actinomycetota bacterium]
MGRIQSRLGQTSLEDLLGGRVLAWLGGIAVVLGIVFLFAIAVSRSWIGETERSLLAGFGSLALLALGVWLHERKARTDAALASVAAGIAGLFVTLTVAAQVYDVLPGATALSLALLVGATATTLAVRWEARGIAALGVIGALLSPLLADAPHSGGTLALLFIAALAATGVLLWQRWDWLALAAFAVVTPQWVLYVLDVASTGGALATMIAFGSLAVAAAVGYELRVSATKARLSSSYLLALNAIVLAVVGWFSLAELDQEAFGKLWLVALAATHVAIGLSSARLPRVSRDLALLALVLGVALADLAFSLLADGPLLTLGWAASAVGFAVLLRRRQTGPQDALLAGAGLGGHVGLALLHTITNEAPPSLVAGGALTATASASLLALAAGCLVSGRLAQEGHPEWRSALDVLGLAALAYLTAIALDGAGLAVAWSLEAAALARLASGGRDQVAALAALSFLALAGAHLLAFEAPPEALVYGLDNVLAAAAAGCAVLAAALVCARTLVWVDPRLSRWMTAASGIALLYVASAALVTPYQPGTATVDSELFELGVRQQGQMLLSVFWSLCGVAVMVVGLRWNLRALRAGGLALLFLAVAKVFSIDLSALGSLYRVVSLCGLGVLLLLGAFVWQRVRPAPLPDLRDLPDGVR